jgi:hypothetical protein
VLAKQDEDAAQVDEAQVVERQALVADHQPTEVAEPSEESLDLPTALVAAQGPSILGLGPFPVAPVRGNHLDTQLHERFVERIGVVGAVANEPVGQLVYEAGVEGCRDEANLVRRSRGGTDGERKTKAVCHCHELRTFSPLGFSHTPAPFFATTKVPSMKHSE